MIDKIRSLLGMKRDRPVPEREQCYIEGCTNRRRGPDKIHGDKCDECLQHMYQKTVARNDVRLGEARAVFERRCFECEYFKIIPRKQPGTPNAQCPECGAEAELYEIDLKIGGGVRGRV